MGAPTPVVIARAPATSARVHATHAGEDARELQYFWVAGSAESFAGAILQMNRKIWASA
jgi:hypothetical protein